MAGTKLGGLHAAETNKKRYGADFYKRIGAVGGESGGRWRGSEKGFAAGEAGRERARIFGAVGGRNSRRGKAVKEEA